MAGEGPQGRVRGVYQGMKVLSYRDSGYAKFVKGLNRRAIPGDDVRDLVAGIISEVSAKGDKALIGYAKKFDRVDLTPKSLFVTEEEFEEAKKAVSPATKKAVAASLKNITEFAKRSMRKDWSYRNAEGARVGERFTPFDRVGVYVPGGKAPLVSTALMTAGFAKAAKVPETKVEFTRSSAMRTLSFWAFSLALASYGGVITGIMFHLTSIGEEMSRSREATLKVFIPMWSRCKLAQERHRFLYQAYSQPRYDHHDPRQSP